MQRPRRMGEGPWVHNDCGASIACSMHRLDQVTFVIRLQMLHLNAEWGGRRPCPRHVIIEGRRAVHLGFTLTEQIEVRPMKEQDGGHSPSRYRAADSRYST